MQATIGHNELPFKLDALAKQACEAREKAEASEVKALEYWTEYGRILNEARALFGENDKGF